MVRTQFSTCTLVATTTIPASVPEHEQCFQLYFLPDTSLSLKHSVILNLLKGGLTVYNGIF